MTDDQLNLIREPLLPPSGARRKARVAMECAEAREVVNDLFRRSMKANTKFHFADKVAPLDTDRIDLASALEAANRIESLMD